MLLLNLRRHPSLIARQILHVAATYPDMTARWGSELSAISEGRSQYKKLMSPLEEQLKELVIQSGDVLPKGLSGLGKQRFTKKRRNSTKGK
jgi:DNA topoisomerase-3